MAKKPREEVNPNEWLNTYADMVTLLLTFFIMLFTMSSVDSEKWQILIKAFVSQGADTSQVVLVPEGTGNSMGGANQGGIKEEANNIPTSPDLPQNFDDLYRYIAEYVNDKGLANAVEVVQENDNVFIRLKDSIFFDPDSAILKNASFDILTHLGDAFKNMESIISVIQINGHTAKVQNYVSSVDRTLSSSRANSVLVYFQDSKQIDPKKLISIGYGNNYAIADNDTADGRSKNRRVELLIIGNGSNYEGSINLQHELNGIFTSGMTPDSPETKPPSDPNAVNPEDVVSDLLEDAAKEETVSASD